MKRRSWYRRLAGRILDTAYRPRRAASYRIGNLRIEPLEERILLDVTKAFPTPLDAITPFGSEVFARTDSDTLAPGSTHTYTIPLAAGQVLTAVLQPGDPSFQAHLALLDPNSVQVASADA